MPDQHRWGMDRGPVPHPGRQILRCVRRPVGRREGLRVGRAIGFCIVSTVDIFKLKSFIHSVFPLFFSSENTSEIFDPVLDSFLPGPPLPFESKYSCALEVPGRPGIRMRKRNRTLNFSPFLHFFLVHTGTVFVAGSADTQDKVYLFDVDEGEVTQETT